MFGRLVIAKLLVCIDGAADEYGSLLSGLMPGCLGVVIDISKDGIQQINDALSEFNDVKSLHSVPHSFL